MQRKKKKAIIISIVVLLIILITIIGICVYLYFSTDAFKSNRTLFEKYLAQNFNVMQNIINNKSNDIENFLENNKYTSNTIVNANYTKGNTSQDENTSEEEQNANQNNINNLRLSINSQTDKANKYDYKDIELLYGTEKAARLEYIKDDSLVGVRLDGVLQFVTVNTQDLENLAEKTDKTEENLNKISLLSTGINISELINFTDEEKQTLSETYTNIIEQNTQKESFKTIKNKSIDVNGNQIIANGYYIETTREQYNNLLIMLLQQVTQDEIILGKVDNIQNKLIEYGIVQNNEETSLRDEFIKYINDYTTEIRNTNIGNELYRVIVYESNGQIVKTAIEAEGNATEIDIYNNGTSVIIKNSKVENKNETINSIKLENISQNNSQYTTIQYEEIQNNIYQRKIQIENEKELQNNKISGNASITYEINGNAIKISVAENIESVENFAEQIKLDETNNITFNDLEKDQITNIINILEDTVNNQINNITNKVTPEELNEILKDLGFIKEDIFKIEEPIEVTEIERNRFNSQLTFFIGQKQSSDNINILLTAIESNLEDATIENITTEREKEELNQITLNITRNSKNDEKLQQVREVIKTNEREEYDVTMSYDEQTQLINRIFIRVHRED